MIHIVKYIFAKDPDEVLQGLVLVGELDTTLAEKDKKVMRESLLCTVKTVREMNALFGFGKTRRFKLIK